MDFLRSFFVPEFNVSPIAHDRGQQVFNSELHLPFRNLLASQDSNPVTFDQSVVSKK